MVPTLSGASFGLEASTAYKAACQYFSEKVRILQLLGVKSGVTRAEIKTAVLGVEKAGFSYSRARDGVAQEFWIHHSRVRSRQEFTRYRHTRQQWPNCYRNALEGLRARPKLTGIPPRR